MTTAAVARDLVMQDSVTAANLTGGADAYLAYVDGNWPTLTAVRARFPHTHIVSLAVFTSGIADGCDCEQGDLMPWQVGAWVKRAMARGVWRPVVYASVSRMAEVLADLLIAGVHRSSVRLLSAHYGQGKHICGPATCAWRGVPACDGTQWTDTAPGAGGSQIDESILVADFFAGPPKPAPAPVPDPRPVVEVVSDGTQSLHVLAASHNTPAATALRLTVEHGGEFAADLAGYVNSVFAANSEPVPLGTKLWTH